LRIAGKFVEKPEILEVDDTVRSGTVVKNLT
jgi:hypothetical protein